MEAATGELRTALALTGEARAAVERAMRALTPDAAGAMPEGPFRPPGGPARAAHRNARGFKIERDAELEAFIRVRMDGLTFKALVAEVAAHFPPERRVSLSALHRWWHRHVAPTRRAGP